MINLSENQTSRKLLIVAAAFLVFTLLMASSVSLAAAKDDKEKEWKSSDGKGSKADENRSDDNELPDDIGPEDNEPDENIPDQGVPGDNENQQENVVPQEPAPRDMGENQQDNPVVDDQVPQDDERDEQFEPTQPAVVVPVYSADLQDEESPVENLIEIEVVAGGSGDVTSPQSPSPELVQMEEASGVQAEQNRMSQSNSSTYVLTTSGFGVLSAAIVAIGTLALFKLFWPWILGAGLIYPAFGVKTTRATRITKISRHPHPARKIMLSRRTQAIFRKIVNTKPEVLAAFVKEIDGWNGACYF